MFDSHILQVAPRLEVFLPFCLEKKTQEINSEYRDRLIIQSVAQASPHPTYQIKSTEHSFSIMRFAKIALNIMIMQGGDQSRFMVHHELTLHTQVLRATAYRCTP